MRLVDLMFGNHGGLTSLSGISDFTLAGETPPLSPMGSMMSDLEDPLHDTSLLQQLFYNRIVSNIAICIMYITILG